MPEFRYTDLLPLGADTTQYRQLTGDGVSVRQAFGRKFLEVEPEALTLVAREGMRDIAHLLRPGHLRQLRAILPHQDFAQQFARNAARMASKESAIQRPDHGVQRGAIRACRSCRALEAGRGRLACWREKASLICVAGDN